MPVLAANQVTLAEILEVKGSPLNEEEIWAVLSHAGKAIERVLSDGRGKQHGQPSLVISPDTLVLSHFGHVKISKHIGREKTKNPTYRAPELNSRNVSPSDGAVEKMYVYSLGMTLYFAAEYALNKSKMGHLSVSLGNLLLSMCEELAKSRYSLRQVLAACGSKYGDCFYSKIIKRLVVLVLGNNIPEHIQSDEVDEERPFARGYTSDDQHPSRSLRTRYRSSLELPPPPLANRTSHGQATSEELIGSNDRRMISPEEQPSYHSKNKYMTKIPHTLDKYRKYLEKARHQKTMTSPVIADRSIDLLRNRYGSMPAMNGCYSMDISSRKAYERTQSLDRNGKGYNGKGSSIDNGLWRSEKSRGVGTGSLGNLNTGQSSDASSETSSLSDHHKSTLSSAPSSSLVSLMEGSYVPATSLTDLGSDYWGSTGSLRDIGGSQRSGEWHHSSIGDLRSVSQQNSHDRGGEKNGIMDMKSQWPNTSGQRKYRSEQNLVSPGTTDGGKKAKKVPKAKLRKFFGPEFVQVLEDPNQSFVNITPKKAEKKLSGRRMVTVVMLNEQRLQMAVEISTKVQELFAQITKYIGVTEKIYFGLTRIEDDEHLFLDFDTKLSKYAPTGWKEQSKKFTGEYVLYFRVKFYVENLALFRHHETSHQLYLQLRSDVIKDHVYIDADPVLNLASLALQAEYGDYNRKRFGENYFKPKHYLPHRILVKLSEEHVSQKLRALHKVQCGLSQDEAEVKFIKESQKLPEYGMHLYKTQLGKKENEIIYLGVCVRGVTIFEFKQNKRKPIERHSWMTIKKLAFKKKKFHIEPRTEGPKRKQNRLTFLSSSYKRSKYLLYLCTSFHRFQMRMKVRLLAMEEAAPEERKRNSLAVGYGAAGPGPHLNGNRENGEEFLNNNEDEDDSSLESREPSRAPSEYAIRQNAAAGSQVDGPDDLPYVLNSTPPSPSSYSDASPSPRAIEKRAAEIIMSPDRKVKVIKLKKDARGALGLTVVGGEDTRRLHFGIFVKKISPGSIAYEDGRLKVGDRLLAVNGKSLEYVSHDEAVQSLKNTPVNVELLVSQSTRTDKDIDMSVIYSPAVDKTQRPAPAHDHRMSPYLAEEQTANGNMHGNHSNDGVTLAHVGRNLESAYEDDGNLQENSPQSTRLISGNSTDAPSSNPSSPEQGTRENHYGGVKLPGMANGRIEDVKLNRNAHHRASGASHVSEESPGSIASYGEKVNRQNSLPNSDMQNRESKGTNDDEGPSRSRSNSWNQHFESASIKYGVSRNAVPPSRPRIGSESEVMKWSYKSDVKELPVGIIMDSANQFTVELDKVSGSLGLNVTGGINTSTTDGSIFVKSLYPNGPADLDGRIQVGHKILSVNGISLQGVTHKQAVETIKRAPVHAVLVIEGSPGDTADHTDKGPLRNDVQGTVFEVVLIKGIGGLGMSLVGGTDCGEEYGDKLRIKAMFPGQPAENSEKLRVGDIIMAANGVSLAGKTSRDAINVLRDQPTRVVLTVKRDPSSIPPALLRRGSFSKNLDPNEVLSAIHSKFDQDASGNDSLSSRAHNNPHEHHEPLESSSQSSSYPKQEGEVVLREKNELHEDSDRINWGHVDQEAISQDKYRTNVDRYGHEGTSLDRNWTERESSDMVEDSPLRRLSNQDGNTTSERNHPRVFEPRTETIEMSESISFVASDQNVLSGIKFQEGISSDSMSDDQIVDGKAFERVESNKYMSNSQMDKNVSGHKDDEAMTTQNFVDDEDNQKERRNSSGRPFRKEKKERLAPDEEVLDVVLHKGSSGLGFSLAGGADTVGGCFVREIIGDPARSDGRLKPKDQIVMVNGQDTTNKKHMEAVNILRATRNEVHLVIRRRPDKVKSKTKDGLNIKTISVIRTTRGIIGLTLAQGKQGEIFAAEVIPEEPAAKDGGLKRGDVILEINGERVDDTDLKFAEACLERARPVVTLVIKQFRNETESKYVLCSPTESDHEVPSDTRQARYSNLTLVQSQGNLPQDANSYNPDFLSSDETSPENIPPEIESTPEQLPPSFLPSGNVHSEEAPSTFLSLDEAHEPPQQELLRKLSADESYSEERISSSFPRQEDLGDAMQGPENEEYPSDDEDLLLKEEVIITSLEKGPRGLGFSLFSGQTVHNTPGLFIRSIQPNSVVEEDDKIKVGDQLTKVNSRDVERLDHSEVITLLRSLSGVIDLELLRIQDVEDDEEPSTSLPRQLELDNMARGENGREVLDTSASPVTTPDFTEDVGIVLDALHTKQEPLSDSQDSLPRPAEERARDVVEETAMDPAMNDNSEEERFESWPQPPNTFELQANVSSKNSSKSDTDNLNPVEYSDNPVATSEDDTTSITFSEDGFLEELEDLQYTPSPDSDRVRTAVGNLSDRSLIPVKPGSTLSDSTSPRFSDKTNYAKTKPSSKQENIEMSSLGANKSSKHSEIATDNTINISNDGSLGHLGVSMGGNMVETSMSLPGKPVSPLIPESFLNASLAMSSSQATTPETPPPVPTTPIPPDDNLTSNVGHKASPRDSEVQAMTMRERFAKVVKQENKGRFDHPLRPKSPLIGRRSKSVEPSMPLLEILRTRPLYSGQRLQNLIEEFEKAVSSGKAAGEFQALREMTPIDNCPSGKRALNKEKNRYRNVLPYEKTRVILTGDEQTDYINANYINITVDEDTFHYIATQGPVPITTGDFWRMVWEQKCQVIAMVTLDMECGKVKCHRYWPESSELPVKVNQSLEVHLESVETYNNYVQRIVRIENLQEEKSLTVVHLNFLAWPDHGVPKSACDLVEFIKHFRAHSSVGPSLVHCSAGIGRTGTLLTIDTCMKHIERGLKFDIYRIVHNLREQRPGMIQTKDQYVFCYQACAEILKSLKVKEVK
ncbi:tyrosine-protein phosphatase non-receptor type 13-like [Dendronephthya gigantea]|uniref:tyrosine-protein phosphatase non-receptor type 13-like n=1 Tax=Dendronephthya gigantea TaxID=151771 RepID=UPI00106D5302|nr:tyrosine-protein phosphatase non-receptor type 13-like [Dendronephthya gigantea]